MLERFCSLIKVVTTFTENHKDMVITNKEIKCIRAIVAVLKEFAGATVFLQGQNYITISHVPRLIKVILDSLVVNEDLDNKTVRQLKLILNAKFINIFTKSLTSPAFVTWLQRWTH